MAERVARHLSDRLGEDAVTAHHGSLSKETASRRRAPAEDRPLKALVATASLELGIDIGHVDLVCQIGSPHRIATLLQRVGRSGHTIAGMPKGRLLPVSRDDLVECAALLRASGAASSTHRDARRAARCARAADRRGDRRATSYARGRAVRARARRAGRIATSRARLRRGRGDAGRRLRHAARPAAALVHRDEVNALLRGRRGSRLLALTSGGAIPEVADYRVVLEPEDTFIGTLNEDFAIESMAGDIFQLGNASWQITQVVAGTVRVARRAGRAADDPVLARRGAGPKRRAVARGVAICGAGCSIGATRSAVRSKAGRRSSKAGESASRGVSRTVAG